MTAQSTSDSRLANIQPPPNPAAPGNARAATHGAYSDAAIQPRARELAPTIFEANAHLEPARDGASVLRYAVVLARLERAYEWLAERADPVFADLDAGEPHRVYERVERWERQADSAEDRLAISPLTRTRLGLDRAKGAAIVDHLERRYGGAK